MANEWTLVTRVGVPSGYVCANATGIEKGAVLKLSGNNTAALANGADDIIVGICASEKIASNGITQVSVYDIGCNGSRFKATLSGNGTRGDNLGVSSTTNMVAIANNALSGNRVIATLLETATTGQTVLVQLNIQAGAGA